MAQQEIEEELAHLRRTVEEMSAEMARQGREIDRLSRHVALLMARAAEAEAEGTGGHLYADVPPPHY